MRLRRSELRLQRWGLAVAIALGWIYWRQLRSMEEAVESANHQVVQAAQQFEAEQRPWVYAEVEMATPFTLEAEWPRPGVNGAARFALRNVGGTPAFATQIDVHVVPVQISGGQTRLEQHRAICAPYRAKVLAEQTGLTVFPGDRPPPPRNVHLRFDEPAIEEAKRRKFKLRMLAVFTCITYLERRRPPADPIVHQTLASYTIVGFPGSGQHLVPPDRLLSGASDAD